MTEPRTEAGRRLLVEYARRPGPLKGYVSAADILAIEDEARSPAREGLREALEKGIDSHTHTSSDSLHCGPHCVDAILVHGGLAVWKDGRAALSTPDPAPAAALDVDRLADAMWASLSDRGVMRIDADSPKELADVAASVARAYARLSTTPSQDPPETT